MEIRCDRCGTTSRDAVYCPACGAALANQPPGSTIEPPGQSGGTGDGATSSSNRLTAALVVTVAVLLVAVIALGAVALRGRDRSVATETSRGEAAADSETTVARNAPATTASAVISADDFRSELVKNGVAEALADCVTAELQAKGFRLRRYGSFSEDETRQIVDASTNCALKNAGLSPSSSTTTTTATTTTRPTTTTTAPPTLGTVWAPNQQGYGEVAPTTIFNGGDPTGLVSNITWDNWGASRATGTGTGLWVDPRKSVADGQRLRATVVAYDLGTCKGRPAYLHVTWYFPSKGESFNPAVNDYDLCP